MHQVDPRTRRDGAEGAMKTMCLVCGETDNSDLMYWGQSADLGWYHRACAGAGVDAMAQHREPATAAGAPVQRRCIGCGCPMPGPEPYQICDRCERVDRHAR